VLAQRQQRAVAVRRATLIGLIAHGGCFAAGDFGRGRLGLALAAREGRRAVAAVRGRHIAVPSAEVPAADGAGLIGDGPTIDDAGLTL
jgi:hypothetical protein